MENLELVASGVNIKEFQTRNMLVVPDPDKLRVLQDLLAQGDVQPGQLYSLADNDGVLRFRFDINGHNSRTFAEKLSAWLLGKGPYVTTKDSNVLSGRLKRNNNLYGSGAYYHPDVFPSAKSVRTMNRVKHLEFRGDIANSENPINLVTAKDYIDYFESFPFHVQESIIRNLFALELTQGCKAACNKVCGLEPGAQITGHIPFEVVSYMF